MAQGRITGRLFALLAGAAVLSACGSMAGMIGAQKRVGSAGVAGLKPLDNPIDPARAMEHTRVLTSAEMNGRMTASAGDYRADDYIVSEFEKLGLPVTKQAFRGNFKGTAHNVIAMLPGSERSQRYVIVGAHKDHLGLRGGRVYHGANDNAAGTAAVLEIARVMTERNQLHGDRPRANILFMTFSGEELGLLGSTYYTKNPIVPGMEGGARPIPLSAITGMVNLDCIAVGNTNTVGTDAVEDETLTRGGLSVMARRRGLTPVFQPFKIPHGHAHENEPGGRPLPPWASSDHASFRRAGVRAICYYAEPVMSKYLHSPNDTIPERDAIKKQPADRFNIDNVARIAALGYDTLKTWANE